MKLLPTDKALVRRRLLRANIILGILVVFIAFVVNVTGEYSNLSEFRAADTIFNYVAIGGLLYAASSFIFCVVSKPFWFPKG